MADSPAQVVAAAKADAQSAVADVKADVAKVEKSVQAEVTAVKTTWMTKIRPWLTHALAVVVGYFTASPSSLVSIGKAILALF